MDFLGHAKKATDHVATMAAGMAADLTDQASGKAAALAEHAANLRDAGINRAMEAIEAFNAALPVVREAGYDLAEVSVELGLPPKVVAAFTVANEVSAAQFEQLIEAHADRRFTIVLLNALREAWKLQSRIRIIGLTPRSMSVEIGFTPSVTIKFR